MARVDPGNNRLGQSAENDTPLNLGNRFNSAGTRRGQTNRQGLVMDSIADSPESSRGRTPSSRSNVDHETTLYPLDLYHAFYHPNMGQTLINVHGNHLEGQQEFHMEANTGNHAFEYPGLIPQSGGYQYVESPFRRMQPLSTGDLFGLRSQCPDDGYQPSGSITAVSNTYSQDLQPESHDTPTGSMHVEATPESSTAPEDVTTGTSSSPVLLSPGSQGPCMSVWYPAGGYPPVGRNRKRRKMNKDELVRNRALKAAGGACENCRRRKKKCHHKDNRLILSAPASTPITTSTSAPTQAQAQAPANAVPGPSHNGSPTYHRNLGPRSVVRPRSDYIRQGATFGQQQQHNPSIASSYGPSLDPSKFSSSDGGAFSNGTMTSVQSDAITLAADEYHPEMGAEARFGMNTAGFGHQFNGRLAPEFDPTNPNNQIGLLETWPNSARERTIDSDH